MSEKYETSKKIQTLMQKGVSLDVTADVMIEESAKIRQQAIDTKMKAWDVFWKENPDADVDNQYVYNHNSKLITQKPN